MTGFAGFCRIAAMIIMLVAAFVNHSTSSSAKSPDIDFDLLYRAAQIANLAYDGKSKILGELKRR